MSTTLLPLTSRIAICAIALIGNSRSLSAQTGTPDPTFGTEGVAILDLPSIQTSIRVITEQSDGKIIAAGAMLITEEPFVRVGMVVRLLPNGELDTDYGDGGYATTEFIDPGNATIMDLAAYEDGRVVICGYTNEFGFIARLLSDGSVDPDFGTAGFVNMEDLLIPETPRQIELAQGGTRIVVGCSGNPSPLVRFMAFDQDGVVDGTFGIPGASGWSFSDGYFVLRAMCSTAGGDFFIGGDVNFNLTEPHYFPFVLRFLASGMPDFTFGESGILLLNPAPDQDDHETVTALVPLADGSLVAGGVNNILQGSQNAFLFKLLPNSVPDPAFGEGGVVHTPLGATGGLNGGLDGELYLACNIVAGTGQVFAAQRFLADGSVDATYGPDGITQLDVEGPYGLTHCSAVQADGRVLVAGNTLTQDISSQAMIVRLRDDLNVGVGTNPSFASPVVYPNPMADHAVFSFELKEEERLSAEVLDAQGKLVSTVFLGRHCPPGTYRETVDLSGFADGSYTLLLSNGAGTTSIQLTKASSER